jgi:AbiV family abortive infection protein
MPAEPILSIVANCNRLLKDSYILLANGSPGSALSLAILAYEEAGKGHRHELNIEKTKRTRSWHVFRQVIAALVLAASFKQKYGLKTPTVSERSKKIMDDRWRNAETGFETPFPEEVRQEIVDSLRPDLRSLDDDQMLIGSIEGRWIKKIVIAASFGKIEELRQKGMYVDLEEDRVISNPADVDPREAVYWIRITERVLRILEFGDYQSPYGELAPILESMPKPLPQGQPLFDLLNKLRLETSEVMMEVVPEPFNAVGEGQS